ncbi:SPOR domain-containing protein [Tenacibaculum sp. M341]|uniref:HU domain-containing protein n=1 Tax=Tenacibaculum sp. M341 TaxID=2530339 RepID=UPI00104DC700|nr:SPOR domain-containing protein [Tenacibaculum sp. M341]TCI92152.1 SPOR domain-containing protein [Tenacibaculum sp. M341]
MMLATYIKDLLYRYDCVIVPNFGGFVTNKVGARIENDTIYPPNKQISFNSQLKHNDGLLANEVAVANKISFEEANKQISEIVLQWNVNLKSETISLEGVGVLSQNSENQLFFEPNKQTNFLTESFGLAPVTASVIEKVQEEVIPVVAEEEATESKVVTLQKERKSFGFVKYAAAAAILVAGVVGVNQYQKNSQINTLAIEQDAIEQKIQKATFIIDDELPTINFNISKENSNHKIHIIAGAFQSEVNANKKIEELQAKGYDAKILGKNNWGLTQVSVGSFATKEAAQEVIEEVRSNTSPDAWILVK